MAINIYLIVVYNQRYRKLLSASLAGAIALGNRPDRFGIESVELENFFYLRLSQMEETLNQLWYFLKIPMLN